MADALAEGIKNVFAAVKETIEAVMKNITAALEYAKENIQTMTEEEYAEFLEELPPEARGWAENIRMRSQNTQNRKPHNREKQSQ